MIVLITGIYGFLGSYLAKKMFEKHTVIGLYHTEKNIAFQSQITCVNKLELIDETPDLIIMCHAAVSSGNAIVDEESLIESNVEFTRQLVKKFPKVKSIYISSVSVFGNTEDVISETFPVNPQTPYAKSKLTGEKTVLQNKNSIIIRFSSLYGNGMKENTLVPNYCNQALDKKSIEVWGTGSRYQNYLHINDAVNLIVKAAEYKSKISFPVLGVSSKEYSNNEVAKIISDLTGTQINYTKDDSSLSFHFNNEMTQNILNWCPETELKNGLKYYLEWKKK